MRLPGDPKCESLTLSVIFSGTSHKTETKTFVYLFNWIWTTKVSLGLGQANKARQEPVTTTQKLLIRNPAGCFRCNIGLGLLSFQQGILPQQDQVAMD